MFIDPVVLSSITAAVSLLSYEYTKGLAGEAGKTTWKSITALFGWHSDPSIADIPVKVADGLRASPENMEKLVELLKRQPTGVASSLVQNVTITGGKVVIAKTVHNLTM